MKTTYIADQDKRRLHAVGARHVVPSNFHGKLAAWRNMDGFTFIELIMAMAVVTIVMASAGTVLAQLFNTNRSATNHMVAIRQVQNAGYWVSHDGVMAQTILDSADLDALNRANDIVEFSWTHWEDLGHHMHTVFYTLDANGQLEKDEHGVRSLVANHVRAVSATFVDTKIDTDGDGDIDANDTGNGVKDKIILTITAAVVPGQQEETRSYEVIPRTRLGQ